MGELAQMHVCSTTVVCSYFYFASFRSERSISIVQDHAGNAGMFESYRVAVMSLDGGLKLQRDIAKS